MRAVRAVLNYLKNGGVDYLFGIPAGSLNALFDELYEMKEMTPVVAKHEGAASYMAAAYSKYSDSLGVCVGCSGPGSTNLITGAANAMREHLPVLFLTGSVPMNTVGLNASQELDAQPIFEPVTKYSVSVQKSEDLLPEVKKAVSIAFSGVPGPVHVAMPLDVQNGQIPEMPLPAFPRRSRTLPSTSPIRNAVTAMSGARKGIIFLGQGSRNAIRKVVHLAELLDWPMIKSPQAKGLVPDDHPLMRGIYGFAGHEEATRLVNDREHRLLLVVGSSLGETASNNWNENLAKNRTLIQIDIDESVFHRKYPVDIPIHGDAEQSLALLIKQLKEQGIQSKKPRPLSGKLEKIGQQFNSQNVLRALQQNFPSNNRYTVDIGEFMSYVIHHMKVYESDTFDINVHFGAMGSAIGSAIGSKLAEPDRPVTCITGDGCFFMHGMEIITAKEYHLPILFVVMNNARLGMVYHGHTLQFKRSHPRFEQEPVDIAAMAAAMNIPHLRVETMQDLIPEKIKRLQIGGGPAILDVALVDNNVPPMGDRVKFLSSFGK